MPNPVNALKSAGAAIWKAWIGLPDAVQLAIVCCALAIGIGGCIFL